jgi:hypothetical protein
MNRLGRFAIYFSIVALMAALLPAASMLGMLWESARNNPNGVGLHFNIYLLWIGQVALYVIAIGLLIATLKTNSRA